MVITIPQFVSEIVTGFDCRDRAFAEWELTGALDTARRSHPDISQEERNGFWAERSAFGLTKSSADESPWGTHYGPTTSGTLHNGTEVFYPDIREADAEVIAYWQRRANEARNPILRARYADVVWDLTKTVTGGKPDVAWARMAISEYLKSAKLKPGERILYGFRRLQRGMEIAISIGDDKPAEAIRDEVVRFFHEQSQPHLIGTWTSPFDALMDLKKPPLLPDQLKGMIDKLESWLAKSVEPDEKGAIYHMTAQEAARRLAHHYRQSNRSEDVKRVLRLYEKPFLDIARQADTLFAMGQLEQVREDYVGHGLKDDAERIAILSKKKAEEQPPRWGKVSGTVQISREKLEAYLNEMMADDVDACLERIAQQFVPSSADAGGQLDSLMRECPLQGRIAVRRFGDGQVIAEAGSIDEDREGQLIFQLNENIGLANMLLLPAIDKARERYSLSAEQVGAFLFRSPVFDESRTGLVAEGVRAWIEGDHIKAVHVLIPQIEGALRKLLGLLGRPTNKHVRTNISVMQEKSLDDVLGDAVTRACLGDDVWRYFSVLLADRRGMNLRNRVAHGLMGAGEFGRPVGDRILHALFLLGLIRENEGPSEVATDNALRLQA